MRKTSLIIVGIVLGVVLSAQQSGTPSQIRVITDATGALMISAAAQTLPLSQPTLFVNTRLRTDSSGSLVVVGGSSSGFAPSDATYITQTPSSGLSAEQALSALSTGIMFVTTTTGVVTSIVPTDDNLVVGNGTAWQLKALSSCSAASSALTYNTTTNAFGCNTISATITGSDTQVLFFDGANNPAGNAGFTFDKTVQQLSVNANHSTAVVGGSEVIDAFNGSTRTSGSETQVGARGWGTFSGVGNVTGNVIGLVGFATSEGTNTVSGPQVQGIRADGNYIGSNAIATASYGVLIASNFVDGTLGTNYGLFIDDQSGTGISGTMGGYAIYTNLGLVHFGDAVTTTSTSTATDFILSGSGTFKTDTTTAHTGLIQAYDVDGAAYKTFATLTNGNTPSFVLSEPAGATLSFSGSTVVSTTSNTSAHYLDSSTPTSIASTSMNSCGTTSPTFNTGSSNSRGSFNVGATSGTDCSLTFSTAAAHFWACTASNDTTGNLVRGVESSTTVTKFQGVFGGADKVTYVCFPY